MSDTRRAVLEKFSLTDATAARLDCLVAELTRWQKTKNLVGPATLAQAWTRHIADSLQLHALAPQAESWLDLGSGAGFPGLVLAILGAEAGFKVTLVESNARKCAFLRHVARLTGAAATVYDQRLEDIIPEIVASIDVVTARALAPLDQLFEWTEPLFRHGATALFPKGRDASAELARAEKSWQLTHEILPSCVDSESCILRVTALARKL